MMRWLLLTLLLVPGLAAQTDDLRVIRSLPNGAQPGDVIAVSLSVRAEGEVTVRERPPRAWEVLDSHPEAAVEGDTLIWTIEGGAALTYRLVIPDQGGAVGVFRGEAGPEGEGRNIDGAETLTIGASINVWGFSLSWWELLGICGALVFASRFMVQWIASERKGKSVVPRAFWYISIVGSAALLAYGIHFRRAAVVLGQSFGFVVYIRNLMLIKKRKREKLAERARESGDPPGG